MKNLNEMNEMQQLHLKLQMLAEEINNIAENNELVSGALYSDLKQAYNLLKDGVI